MDFKRVEKIFILVFLLLNLYLLTSYLGRSDLQSASTSSTSPVDFLQEINDLGVDLPHLDDEPRQATAIQTNNASVELSDFADLANQEGDISEDLKVYTATLDNPIDLHINDEVRELSQADLQSLQNFLESDQVLFGESYRYQYYDYINDEIIFTQEHDGLPIDDGTAELALQIDQTGTVYGFHQTFAGEIIPQGEELDLISDQDAVEILFQNNEISQNTTILAPRLVYYRSLNLQDLSVYNPAWKISMINGEGAVDNHYIDAWRGQVINEPILGEAASNNGTSTGQSESRPVEEAQT